MGTSGSGRPDPGPSIGSGGGAEEAKASTRSSRSSSHRIALGRESLMTCSNSRSEYAGLAATSTAPARKTPTTAAAKSALFPPVTTTRLPGITPEAASADAKRRARSRNSRPLSQSPVVSRRNGLPPSSSRELSAMAPRSPKSDKRSAAGRLAPRWACHPGAKVREEAFTTSQARALGRLLRAPSAGCPRSRRTAPRLPPGEATAG